VPIRAPKTAQLIADQLRRQIVLGELTEGDLLPNESSLMEQFGVSRPTLREALRVLEAEAFLLITRGSRDGARVITPSERNAARYVGLYLQYKRVPVLDVHEALTSIEIPAVVHLARNSTPADLEALEAAADGAQPADRDWMATVSAGVDFHRLLVDLAGNRTLLVLHGLLDEVIVATSRDIGKTSQEETAEQARNVSKVHKEIIDLIRDQAVAAAEDLWRRHLRARMHALEQTHLSTGNRGDGIVSTLGGDYFG
jgi:GntR family transcriptional repressor for pyruvate dehydrogenase complex